MSIKAKPQRNIDENHVVATNKRTSKTGFGTKTHWTTEYPIQTDPGALMELPITDLQIDHTYQRSLREYAAMNIARNWNWQAVKPLSVSYRGYLDMPESKKYFVTDGQHLLWGARMRGDIKELPCYVIEFDSVVDEAIVFDLINTHRTSVGAADIHKARIVGESDLDLRVREAYEKYGLILHVPGAPMTPVSFKCIAAFIEAEKKLADKGGLNTVLEFTENTWGFNEETLNSVYVKGVTHFFRFMPKYMYDRIPLLTMCQRVARADLDDLLAKARKTYHLFPKTAINKLLAVEIAKAHDYKLTKPRERVAKMVAQGLETGKVESE